MEEFVYFNGEFVPSTHGVVNIKTHALQYGTAVFEGIRAYWNDKKGKLNLLMAEAHYQRLHRSARIMMMKPPHTATELVEITRDLLKRNNARQNTYIRPFLYKSSHNLGPKLHGESDGFAIYTLPLEDYVDTTRGLKLKVASWRRLPDNVIPARAKVSGGYVNSALARTEVAMQGYDEAIMLDIEGYAVEGSAENLFIVRDGILITPDRSSDILEGCTRAAILTLARKELKIPVEERRIARNELYIADEMFLSGTGCQIGWIHSVDERIIGTGLCGPITTKIRELYNQIVYGDNPAYRHWLTEV